MPDNLRRTDRPKRSTALSWRPMEPDSTHSEGRRFQVLSLDQLIAVKSFVGRPKDRIVEMELRAIRERRS